jgi:glycogen debranching enzyme
MSKLESLADKTAAILHGRKPKAGDATAHGDKSQPPAYTRSKPAAVHIPQQGFDPSAPMKTPKTPADDALDFFESAIKPGEAPIQVYELKLDPDGGPNKDRSVRPYALKLRIYFI